MVPLIPLRGLDPIDGILPIILFPLGPLPYPIDIISMPAYLGLSRRKGGPICPLLVLVPLQLLPQIGNLLDEPSNIIGPGVALSLPCLSHNPICLIYLSYKIFVLVPSVISLLLICPQTLYKIPPPPHQGMNLPLQMDSHQFLLHPDLLGVPLYIEFFHR